MAVRFSSLILLLLVIFAAIHDGAMIATTGKSAGASSSKSPTPGSPRSAAAATRFGNSFKVTRLKNSLPVSITFTNLSDDEVSDQQVEPGKTAFLATKFPFKISIADYNEDFLFSDAGDWRMLIINCKNLGDKDMGGGITFPDLMCKEFKYQDLYGTPNMGDYELNLWNDDSNGGQLWLRADYAYLASTFAYQITGITRQYA